jgi:[ribosomal protein S18]-alanine N-acetyltransferase
MSKINIRRMCFDDIDRVMKIEREASLGSWSRQGYEAEFERNDSLALIGEYQAEIVGFGIARLITTAAEAEILNIGVKPYFQHRGIGTELIREIFYFLRNNEIKQVLLEVRESNVKAQKFYCKCGFEVIGRRKNFYNNPSEDGLTLKIDL